MTADQAAHDIALQLESAWNSADGSAFAAPFAADADFVDIRGEHHRGVQAIGHGHHAIFQSIYRGSRMAYRVTQVRAINADTLLVHIVGALDAPTGPLAGRNESLQTLVLNRTGEGWEIAAFHNTLVMKR